VRAGPRGACGQKWFGQAQRGLAFAGRTKGGVLAGVGRVAEGTHAPSFIVVCVKLCNLLMAEAWFMLP
jgi:hypothetical protein